jgi:hypothetical protein
MANSIPPNAETGMTNISATAVVFFFIIIVIGRLWIVGVVVYFILQILKIVQQVLFQ